MLAHSIGFKIENSHTDTFPFPINSDGKSLNWHLAEILKWYIYRGTSIDSFLLEVAEFAMQFNLEKQNKNINSDRNLIQKARALVKKCFLLNYLDILPIGQFEFRLSEIQIGKILFVIIINVAVLA